MTDYRPPIDDIRSALDLIGLRKITSWPDYEHVNTDVTNEIIEEAGRFMAEVIAPLDHLGVTHGAVHRNGKVSHPPEFRTAYKQYVDAGWNAVKSPTKYGGHGFPIAVNVAVQEMLTSACISFSLCPMLTQSAALLVQKSASSSLKDIYLKKLVSGKWAGTMALTEPQAGSDIGSITTRAEPQSDGTWRIFGTKIFITWGEHDLAENIIHFVIARAPDSPPGVKGISLFLVPKFIPSPDGSVRDQNDLQCVSIEHKIGIHASPTCVMSFGEQEGAIGYIVGEVHNGMAEMFKMMNDARIAIALEGLATGEKAYQQAIRFAVERQQGKAIGSEENVSITEHPDIQRMLVTMRSTTAAMRGIIYDTAARLDAAEHHPDPETAQISAAIGRLLTPVAKAWCTDRGIEMASLNIQIHGGMGYIEETGPAQLWRDSRIGPIYEGTNGIQAIDLVMRSLPEKKGAAVNAYLTEIEEVAAEAATSGDLLGQLGESLQEACQTLRTATEWLLEASNPSDQLAGATPYLTMFGTIAGARYLVAAAISVKSSANEQEIEQKTALANFFVNQIVPGASGLLPAVTAGAASLTSASGHGTLSL